MNQHISMCSDENNFTPSYPMVFYDGNCPLCSREIEHYKRCHGSDRLIWIDINTNQKLMNKVGLDKDDAMSRFHVLDTGGQWHTGAWAFTELWSHISAYQWLSWTIKTLKFTAILDLLYTKFAVWRLRRNCNALKCKRSETKR